MIERSWLFFIAERTVESITSNDGELIEVIKSTNEVVNSTNLIVKELSKNTESMLNIISKQNETIVEKKKYKRFKVVCVCASVVLLFSVFYFLYFQSNIRMYDKYAEIVSKYERVIEDD